MKKRSTILLLLALSFAAEAMGAKKDFKGLFGSYRREKFTENEARSTDIGMDILLSTLLPLTPLVKSDESGGGTQNALYYSTFFNFEGSVFFSIAYHWQLFANIGYYSYSTRRQNSLPGTQNLPLFHEFELSAVPVILGLKYRLSTEDIVPYVGLGAGVSLVKRRGSYDSNKTIFNEDNVNALTGELIFGVEFYIASRIGIRLEAAAYYMKLPPKEFNPRGTPAILPILHYQANPWSVRYASGLFMLF